MRYEDRRKEGDNKGREERRKRERRRELGTGRGRKCIAREVEQDWEKDKRDKRMGERGDIIKEEKE